MIFKYYHTLKYLRKEQTIGRIYSIIKRKYLKQNIPDISLKLETNEQSLTDYLFYDPTNRREEILKGNFIFLNHCGQTGNPINWDLEEFPLLWKFNLHYFNYGFLLNKSEFENICINWLNENHLGKGTGWHSYPLSLRIVNWIKMRPENEVIKKSIYQQASFLYRNMEFYFPGNHYLENAKALYFAGKYFNGSGESDKWLSEAKRIFYKELPIQVLSDGGYFERSTMYHAIMLFGLLDMYNITLDDEEFCDFLKKNITKMLNYLNGLTHPNGEITLFNDSAEGIAPETKVLNEYAHNLGFNVIEEKNIFTDSGYYVFKNKNIYFALDAGKIGPDYLPAHSHSDIFSYELSVSKKKIITDTGVFEYKHGIRRNYSRSASAHNTISIDGIDQIECWGSFRVARRYKPENINYEYNADRFNFSGEYKGFARLIGDKIIHRRNIHTKDNTISVRDSVSGKGNHLVKSYIHLHPDCSISTDGNEYYISLDEVSVKIVIKDCSHEIEETEYYPQFGIALTQSTIILSKASIPAEIDYDIVILK